MKEHLKSFGIAVAAVLVGLWAYDYLIVPMINKASVSAPVATK